MRLPLEIQGPICGHALLDFLGRHAVLGVEAYRGGPDRLDYARSVRLRSGPAVLALSWAGGTLAAEVAGGAESDGAESDRAEGDGAEGDGAEALRLVRHLADLDHDPGPVAAHLSRDPALAPLVAAAPGLRVPGTVDPAEHLLRTMLGQQISLAAAARLGARLAERYGTALPPRSTAAGTVDRLFPTADQLAGADPDTLPMPRARARALVGAAGALAGGTLVLGHGVLRGGEAADLRARLLAVGGIGPWTADYVLMRARHDPDVLLGSDLVIRRELQRRGLSVTDGWSPWRSYATMHLWQAWLTR